MSDAPYQVFGFNGHDIYTRGYQSGYNICNSTTEGDSSLCQTMVQNSIFGACLLARLSWAVRMGVGMDVRGWSGANQYEGAGAVARQVGARTSQPASETVELVVV